MLHYTVLTVHYVCSAAPTTDVVTPHVCSGLGVVMYAASMVTTLERVTPTLYKMFIQSDSNFAVLSPLVIIP